MSALAKAFGFKHPGIADSDLPPDFESPLSAVEARGCPLSTSERHDLSRYGALYEVVLVLGDGQRIKKRVEAETAQSAVDKLADPYVQKGMIVRYSSAKNVSRSFE